MITGGIEALGTDAVRQILAAVASFDEFSEQNDPWGEHDCAALMVGGHRIIFKLDLYEDPGVKGTDGQPTMLAEEW